MSSITWRPTSDGLIVVILGDESGSDESSGEAYSDEEDGLSGMEDSHDALTNTLEPPTTVQQSSPAPANPGPSSYATAVVEDDDDDLCVIVVKGTPVVALVVASIGSSVKHAMGGTTRYVKRSLLEQF